MACILSCFVDNIVLLTITHGFALGTAVGMLFFPGTLMVSYYFDKKRPLAYGVTVSGISLGPCLTAPLMSYILSTGGNLRTVFYCQAGIVGCCGLLGCLLFPPDQGDFRDDSDSYTSGIHSFVYKPKLAQNFVFLIYLFGMALVTFSLIVPQLLLPQLMTNAGLSLEQSSKASACNTCPVVITIK